MESLNWGSEIHLQLLSNSVNELTYLHSRLTWTQTSLVCAGRHCNGIGYELRTTLMSPKVYYMWVLNIPNQVVANSPMVMVIWTGKYFCQSVRSLPASEELGVATNSEAWIQWYTPAALHHKSNLNVSYFTADFHCQSTSRHQGHMGEFIPKGRRFSLPQYIDLI